MKSHFLSLVNVKTTNCDCGLLRAETAWRLEALGVALQLGGARQLLAADRAGAEELKYVG
jgi:hypothetical protein